MKGRVPAVAGIINDAEAIVIKEHIVDATVGLKSCSIPPENPALEFLIPPAKKQHPSTNKMFERTLPNILDCTIRISPFFNATILTCYDVSKASMIPQK
jgi:hypothetical protein